jgi:hypothetical protein
MVESTEKRIQLTDNSFEAGGVKYIIHSSLNIERYRHLDELQVRAAYGTDYAGLFRGFLKWVELKNASKPFDADTHLRNVFEGVLRKQNKQNDPLLLICTLFCDPEGADRTAWSEEQANETIEAWSREGYPVEDFFKLGLEFVRRYQVAFQPDFLNTSETEES